MPWGIPGLDSKDFIIHELWQCCLEYFEFGVTCRGYSYLIVARPGGGDGAKESRWKTCQTQVYFWSNDKSLLIHISRGVECEAGVKKNKGDIKRF